MLTVRDALHQLGQGFGLAPIPGSLGPGVPLGLVLEPPDGVLLSAVPARGRRALATAGARPTSPRDGLADDLVPDDALAAAVAVLEDLPPELEEVLEPLDVRAEVLADLRVDGHAVLAGERDLTAGPAALSLRLVVAPPVVEAGGPSVDRVLEADVTVRLHAGEEQVDVAMPTLSVRLMALELPTVLVLCRHRGFAPVVPGTADPAVRDGFTLAVVPGDSPIQADQLDPTSAMARLRNGLNVLAPAASRLSGVPALAHLDAVLSLLDEVLVSPRAAVLQADAVPNLNRITMADRGGVRHDTEADRQVSSLLLLGQAGRTIKLFCRKHQREGEGRLDVTTGPGLLAVVPDLGVARHDTSGLARIALPPGTEPRVRAVEPTRTPLKFNDSIRSLAFA